jgi:hypothetical protein
MPFQFSFRLLYLRKNGIPQSVKPIGLRGVDSSGNFRLFLPAFESPFIYMP